MLIHNFSRYYVSGTIEISKGKVVELSTNKDIDLNGISVVQLYLVSYDDNSRKMTTIYIGYFKLDDINELVWSSFHNVEFLEVDNNVLNIYIRTF